MRSVPDNRLAGAAAFQWLRDRSRDCRDETAVIDSSRSWPYGEVYAAAERCVRVLGSRYRIGPGDRVVTLLPGDGGHVRLLHALMLLGAVSVPLHPRLHPSEIERRIHALSPALIVHDGRSGPDTTREGWLGIDRLDEFPDAGGSEEAVPLHSPTGSDPLCILFTSGTAGGAKAVPLTYGNHLSSAQASAENLGVSASDNWLCPLSLAHAGGFAVMIRSVIYGTTMTIRDGFDAEDMLAAMRGGGVTLVSLVPTMLRRVLDFDPGFNRAAVPSLRAILLGGGPADEEMLGEAARRGLPVLTSYGLTETASQVVTLPLNAPADKKTSSGKALPRAVISIRDESGRECATGESGEIWISGPMVTRGYLPGGAGDPDRFRSGWFRSGDIGSLDRDGYLRLEMRREDLIVSGGENIAPAEVERALRSHPAVRDAVVVGLPDPEWGQVVGAAVVLHYPVPFAELEEHCRTTLAGFQIPRRWIAMESLPLTPSGKVSRTEIAKRMVMAGEGREEPGEGSIQDPAE